jgi:hypothetical protein
MIRHRSAIIVAQALLPAAAALVVVGLLAAGCGTKQHPKEANVSPRAPVALQPAPGATAGQPAPAAPRTEQRVAAAPVPGWDLTPNPAPGVLFRYVRPNSEHPFSPKATVVSNGERAESPAEYAERAREALRKELTSYQAVAEQDVPTEHPPFHKAVFTCMSGIDTFEVMQLYFVRDSGEVVTVTFTALTDQWDHLRGEFRQILSSIVVPP